MNQHQQQHPQQHVPMATEWMPPTAMYVDTNGNSPVQHGSFIPSAAAVSVPVARPAAGNPGYAEMYPSRQSIGIGITLIFLGAVAIILNGVLLLALEYTGIATLGSGFGSGSVFILTGSFGIAAANKRRCLIGTFMAMACLSTCVAIVPLVLGILDSISGSNLCRYAYRYYSQQPYQAQAQAQACWGPALTDALLAFTAFMAGIISLWGLAICIRAVCCCVKKDSTLVAAQHGNQQVVFASQHQPQFEGCVQYYNPQAMPRTYTPSTNPLGSFQSQQQSSHPQQQYSTDPSFQHQQLHSQQHFVYDYAPGPSVGESYPPQYYK